MGNHAENVYQRLFPDLFLTLVNNSKKPLHVGDSFKRYFQRGLSKSLKKLIPFFFLSNPVPFNGQSYLKQKRPGTSDQSLFRLQSKFMKFIDKI